MNDAQGPSKTDVNHPVSSPASTGGAGTTFEQHVGAYWLAQLLVGAIPPILTKTTIKEVFFQTERIGWNTDDFLISCVSGTLEQKMVGQVKRAFTVSASDDECAKTIIDFWKDFNGQRFSRETDRFVLVTLRGTNTLLEHFVGLLDSARAARDGAEFKQRLGTPGFISKTAGRYCDELLKIISGSEGGSLDAMEIWPFLCTLHVLSLDLHNSTRQTESHIKSMLALTVSEDDPVASAEATWNELVAVASVAMTDSRSLRRDDLSTETRARHGVISTNDRRVIQALHDHTEPVLRAIRSTLGPSFHLARGALVQGVLAALENTQVVLVTGPAGSGKSGVCKDAVGVLAKDHILFGFRAEEFAQPHLDSTLVQAQIPANWKRLDGILGAQDRKVILVESVERLLEKPTRDAFTDLISLAIKDQGVRIVLTCRDYSEELVRTSFLRQGQIRHTVIHVPSLNDNELQDVESAHPTLSIPLKSPALRDVLRNLFLLDKALSISWSSEKSLPQSEREFRGVFWREVVRQGQNVVPAMGRKREEVLQIIAVRRAQALTSHVSVGDLNEEVVESLLLASLITRSESNTLLVATAHDVIEDWAILQWIDGQNLPDQSYKALSGAIGTYPAIRRSFRKWVDELVERDAAASGRMFQAAVSETDISTQFRDDTLVSLLKASLAPSFLEQHEYQLLVNDRKMLKRVIHLLRVACVKMPDWLNGVAGTGSVLNVPDGFAWPAVLRIIHRNLNSFPENERLILLGLVEDSVRGVTWSTPNPEGAEDIAAISHWILDGLREYGSEDLLNRVLKVVAKIPLADTARFEAMLHGQIEQRKRRRKRRDSGSEAFRKLIFSGVEGAPAARDIPEIVMSIAADYLLASEPDVTDDHRDTRSILDIESYFGIEEGLDLDFSPPSGLRGPWLTLLRTHPIKAIEFFLKVFNQSADWYVHPRLQDPLEKAWEVRLTFADGSTQTQWMNYRLWGLYRGITVGPYALMSMLMALETWLLEVGKQGDELLDDILIRILRLSENAALSAVVASVATAYPNASAEALLVLLGIRDFIMIDRTRLTGELQITGMAGLFSTMRSDTMIYESERKTANALPHRQHDLEMAIQRLQFGPFVRRVQEQIDRHLTSLPPKQEQTHEDRLWRLALYRMDLRQHTITEVVDSVSPDLAEAPQRYFRLDPKPLDADVQSVVDAGASRGAEISARYGLLLWGVKAFKREAEAHDLAKWVGCLLQAQAMDRELDEYDGSRHAPGLIAAVCARDRWDEMTLEQRNWCVDRICTEVMKFTDTSNGMKSIQKSDMAADRACASVLASLLRKSLHSAQVEKVRATFVAALTHAVDQVRMYATFGIDDQVWSVDREFALRCVNAIATEAATIDEAQRKIDAQNGSFRRQHVLGDIARSVKSEIRSRFWEDGWIAPDAHVTLDVSRDYGRVAHARMLVIFGRVPMDPLAIEAFVRASHSLAQSWAEDDQLRRGERDFHAEVELSARIQSFLLYTSREAAQRAIAPLLATVNRHTRELQSLMNGLTSLQDSRPNAVQYWFLWDLFASAVRGADWISSLGNERHQHGADLLSAIFLASDWKEGVRHWRYLEGYAHHVDALFEALPAAPIVLDVYAQFLYHIGEQSLPGAFQVVADALQRGNSHRMLANPNTVFLLEVLLQRYVYGRPIELKRNELLRTSILFLLDCLVESGSSAAFRMRDDFVTESPRVWSRAPGLSHTETVDSMAS